MKQISNETNLFVADNETIHPPVLSTADVLEFLDEKWELLIHPGLLSVLKRAIPSFRYVRATPRTTLARLWFKYFNAMYPDHHRYLTKVAKEHLAHHKLEHLGTAKTTMEKRASRYLQLRKDRMAQEAARVQNYLQRFSFESDTVSDTALGIRPSSDASTEEYVAFGLAMFPRQLVIRNAQQAHEERKDTAESEKARETREAREAQADQEAREARETHVTKVLIHSVKHNPVTYLKASFSAEDFATLPHYLNLHLTEYTPRFPWLKKSHLADTSHRVRSDPDGLVLSRTKSLPGDLEAAYNEEKERIVLPADIQLQQYRGGLTTVPETGPRTPTVNPGPTLLDLTNRSPSPLTALPQFNQATTNTNSAGVAEATSGLSITSPPSGSGLTHSSGGGVRLSSNADSQTPTRSPFSRTRFVSAGPGPRNVEERPIVEWTPPPPINASGRSVSAQTFWNFPGVPKRSETPPPKRRTSELFNSIKKVLKRWSVQQMVSWFLVRRSGDERGPRLRRWT